MCDRDGKLVMGGLIIMYSFYFLIIAQWVVHSKFWILKISLKILIKSGIHMNSESSRMEGKVAEDKIWKIENRFAALDFFH